MHWEILVLTLLTAGGWATYYTASLLYRISVSKKSLSENITEHQTDQYKDL